MPWSFMTGTYRLHVWSALNLLAVGRIASRYFARKE
jgi:hypothetical protein